MTATRIPDDDLERLALIEQAIGLTRDVTRVMARQAEGEALQDAINGDERDEDISGYLHAAGMAALKARTRVREEMDRHGTTPPDIAENERDDLRHETAWRAAS